MKTRKKICFNCKLSNSNKKGTVRKKIASWKKKIGLHTKFPNDEVPLLKIKCPNNYNTIYKLDLSKKFADRYIYYYAATKKDMNNCISSVYSAKAYGNNFPNKGVTKTDKNGIAKLKLNCPQSYYVNKHQQHISHIHYLISSKDNKNWEKTLFTERIICPVKKTELKKIIDSQCAVIINALPYSEYIKKRIPNSISIPYDSLKKISNNELLNYLKEMLVHYPKINKMVNDNKLTIKNVPIIVYCYNNKCNASKQLIDKLIQMGFSDLKEYPMGIVNW